MGGHAYNRGRGEEVNIPSRAACRIVYGYDRKSTAVIRYESAVTRTVNQRPRRPTVRDGCQYGRIRYGTAVPAVRKVQIQCVQTMGPRP